ncbi:kinesin-like protein KIN-6 [Impatiens glandulifera]|uniref:kinesin-like protein KIN-6 n=1 Tax=Impatiens glandulifera TaxID=253017 RepID=UPI001FB0E275|nr:kinesin-like protein KIN-6 [Impatiens glandulifera]
MGEEAGDRTPIDCPQTVTIRRNPHRRARPTASSVKAFPTQEILAMDDQDEDIPKLLNKPEPSLDRLEIFLRLRPLTVQNRGAKSIKSRTVLPNKISRNLKTDCVSCVTVTNSTSVTVSPPSSLKVGKRAQSEVFEGFSQVFGADSSQEDVYLRMMSPLVNDFLHGKSGMLATLGATGSGKTHTVFGSIRNPGIVPQALQQIFSFEEAKNRIFHISMFEIYSEKGKGEKMFDLSQDGGDLWMQQSVVKGLKEAVICNAKEAEAIIECGLLKRATASTNSNHQSSRSQCIISIRCVTEKAGGQVNSATLTFVDLAGAEREKRTGNQGERLLESNFINNTSMVFGLCLRSLLEHQNNPKKPLQKHYQNSLLTRYLRDYLEGKKRMALILTIKSGDDDYLDSTHLLRQASPFMKIKFHNVEEADILLPTKRQLQTLPKSVKSKRRKLVADPKPILVEGKAAMDECQHMEEDFPSCTNNIEDIQQPVKEISNSNESSPDVPVEVEQINLEPICENNILMAKKERENKIMEGVAKALLNVLKEYRDKLKAAENEIVNLQGNLSMEKTRSSGLELELENLKSSCLCSKEITSTESEKCLSVDMNQCVSPERGISPKPDNNSGDDKVMEDKEIENTLSVPSVIDSEAYAEAVGLESVSLPLETSDSGCPTFATEIKLHDDGNEKESKPAVKSNEKPITQSGKKSHGKKSVKCEKPRRRLAPASSNLLREINNLKFEDENEKPKGGNKGEKKTIIGAERNMQKGGSMALLQLIRTTNQS